MAELVSVNDTFVADARLAVLSVIWPDTAFMVTAVALLVSCVDVLPLPAP